MPPGGRGTEEAAPDHAPDAADDSGQPHGGCGCRQHACGCRVRDAVHGCADGAACGGERHAVPAVQGGGRTGVPAAAGGAVLRVQAAVPRHVVRRAEHLGERGSTGCAAHRNNQYGCVCGCACAGAAESADRGADVRTLRERPHDEGTSGALAHRSRRMGEPVPFKGVGQSLLDCCAGVPTKVRLVRNRGVCTRLHLVRSDGCACDKPCPLWTPEGDHVQHLRADHGGRGRPVAPRASDRFPPRLHCLRHRGRRDASHGHRLLRRTLAGGRDSGVSQRGVPAPCGDGCGDWEACVLRRGGAVHHLQRTPRPLGGNGLPRCLRHCEPRHGRRPRRRHAPVGVHRDLQRKLVHAASAATVACCRRQDGSRRGFCHCRRRPRVTLPLPVVRSAPQLQLRTRPARTHAERRLAGSFQQRHLCGVPSGPLGGGRGRRRGAHHAAGKPRDAALVAEQQHPRAPATCEAVRHLVLGPWSFRAVVSHRCRRRCARRPRPAGRALGPGERHQLHQLLLSSLRRRSAAALPDDRCHRHPHEYYHLPSDLGGAFLAQEKKKINWQTSNNNNKRRRTTTATATTVTTKTQNLTTPHLRCHTFCALRAECQKNGACFFSFFFFFFFYPCLPCPAGSSFCDFVAPHFLCGGACACTGRPGCEGPRCLSPETQLVYRFRSFAVYPYFFF
eukprot:Rhum_TRINITY_DN15047_c6_g2::Rhum_TRINITY_DN15047_c6_g2_i13::g.136211::m.136211